MTEVSHETLGGSETLMLARPLRGLPPTVATSPLRRGRERKQAARLLKGKGVELN